MMLLIVTMCIFIAIKRCFISGILNFAHSEVRNFSAHSMSELFKTSNTITNKRLVRHSKTDNALFKTTNRGLLIKTLKVFNIPSMMQNFSLIRLEFVIARSDDARYDVGAFPVGS